VSEFLFATVIESEICDAVVHQVECEKWKTSVVLPIPRVSNLAKFSDYRPCLFVEGY
jgi:hypothetical protein